MIRLLSSCTFLILRWAVALSVVFGVKLLLNHHSKAPTPLPRLLSASHVTHSPFLVATLRKRLPQEAVARIQDKLDLFEHQQRARLISSLARSTRYIERYRRIFRERSMPEELAYLPIIESGFHERALSPAQAAGVWQFIPETGKRYALHQNAWTDRRLDPIQSAKAAASLLQKMYQQFGSWELALASYNGGAGLVRWAKRKNQRALRPTHYWALDLPEETQNYVPAFIAATLIAKNPAAFGFRNLPFEPKIQFEHLMVSPGTPLDVLAQRLEVKHKLLELLNPHLLQGMAPPNRPSYALRVPKGLTAKLLKTRHSIMRQHHYTTQTTNWMVHPVLKEDTAKILSTRFQVPLKEILEVNQLASEGELLERPYVIIPVVATDEPEL